MANRSFLIFLVGVGIVVGFGSGIAADQSLSDPPPLDLPEGTRPAIAILTPRPTIPEEVLGADNPPEVSVRLTVGETGKVTEVEIMDIEPSGPLDDHYRRAVVESILQWRYAPAKKDGKLVSVLLRLTVAFPTAARRMDVAKGKTSSGDVPLLTDRSPDRLVDRSAMLRALPLKMRQEMLLRISKTAFEMMEQADVKKHVGARFVVYTDLDDGSLGPVVARNLEAVFNFLEQMFGLQVQHEPFRIQVFLYRKRENYARLTSQLGKLENAEAFYHLSGLMVMHAEMRTNDEFMETMLHEAAHAFLDRHIFRPGVVHPRWFGEGLAEYIGTSKIVDGTLEPGAIERRAIYRAPWGIVAGPSFNQMKLDELRKKLRGKVPIPIEALLEFGPNEFYGQDAIDNYMLSWLLIHYLRHGVEGGEEKFQTMLLYIAEGIDATRVLFEIYGPIEEWREAFRKYIRKLA